MVQLNLKAPGLYLRTEETEAAPPNSTGITGFVGLSEKGPLNIPQALRSWQDYTQVFGGFIDYGYLAESVFGFFLNGGEKCWVVRVADTRDRSSENLPNRCRRVELLRRASNLQPIVDAAGGETLRIESIDQGSWGNEVRFFLQPETGREMELTNLTRSAAAVDTQIVVGSVFDLAVDDTVVISRSDDPNVRSSPLRVLTIDPPTRAVGLNGQLGHAFPSGSIVRGRGFRLVVTFRDQRESFSNLSMTEDHPRYVLRIVNGEPPIQDYIQKTQHGTSALVRVARGNQLRSKPVALPNAASTAQEQDEGIALQGGGDGFENAHAVFHDSANLPLFTVTARRDRGHRGNGIRVAASAFQTVTALRVPTDTGSASRVVAERVEGFVVGDSVTITNAANTETNNLLQLNPAHTLVLNNNLANSYPIGSQLSVANRFNLHVFRQNNEEPAERFFNLSSTPGPRFYQTIASAGSSIVCMDPPDNPFPTLTPDPQNPPAILLSGGHDPGEMDYRYYTGYEPDGSFFSPPDPEVSDPIGLAAFEAIDEVSLLAMPDLVHLFRENPEGGDDLISFIDAQHDLLKHCFKMGERFALLDPVPNATPAKVSVWPEHFPEKELQKFGALYYPWIFATFENLERPVPPSGLIAGVTAYSDILNGVHKAPANAVVKGAFDLGILVSGEFQNIAVDREVQNDLNPEGVNCLRKFESGAIRIHGARTLSVDQASRYVNIRRVVLSVVKELSRNMLWTVFEPNDSTLWKRIETSLTRFFQSMLAKGMTASNRPSEAFFVRCSNETNPSERVDAGEVVAEVGIALLAPAEFIVLTARRTPNNLRVIEEET